MTSDDRPIPVPFANRVRFLLTQQFQAVLFAICVAAVVVLWFGDRPRLVLSGQVVSVQIVVPASRDGVLQSTSQSLSRFDRVEQGITSLARFDVSELLLLMQSLTTERDQLLAELDSEREKIRQGMLQWQWQIDQQIHQQQQLQFDRAQANRSALERVDELNGQASTLQQKIRDTEIRRRENVSTLRQSEIEIAVLEIERSRVNDLIQNKLSPATERERIDRDLRLHRESFQTAHELDNLMSLQSDELNQQYLATEKRLSDAKDQLAMFLQSPGISLDSLMNPIDPAANTEPERFDAAAMLEPFRRAVDVHDTKIQILASQIASNQILSPIAGTVAEIHQFPGSYVRSGDPIMTIAADQHRWIVAYLDPRDHHVVDPQMSVGIRIRGNDAMIVSSTIAQRGQHFEEVPIHLRRDFKIAQLGLPIKVAVPAEIDLMPGQIVELVIQ